MAEATCAVDKLCYGMAETRISEDDISLRCLNVVKKAAALGLDRKEILAEATTAGLEKLGTRIADEMQNRNSEIRCSCLMQSHWYWIFSVKIT
jgi:hypothetical protein